MPTISFLELSEHANQTGYFFAVSIGIALVLLSISNMHSSSHVT